MFTAIQISGKINEGTNSMLTKVYDLIIDNAEKYNNFGTNKENTAYQKDEFNSEVEKLKNTGTWNNDIADILSMTVANYLGVH